MQLRAHGVQGMVAALEGSCGVLCRCQLAVKLQNRLLGRHFGFQRPVAVRDAQLSDLQLVGLPLLPAGHQFLK